MAKENISNALLVIGILLLATFGLTELNGITTDPLLPAFSALLIGSTAVLDRIGVSELE